MDVGDGLPDTYRVLKLDGTEALVLAMQDYNIGTTYKYNATSKTTTFGSYTGQQYAGSDLDILLNTTMYGEMNSTAKSAIVAKNINQNMFLYSDEPNELNEMFFNQNTAYSGNLTNGYANICFRSANSGISTYAWYVSGGFGFLHSWSYDYAYGCGVHPAFVINLSKIEYEVVK